MYLAVKHLTGKPAYVIRESYHCEDRYRSRDLFDLGKDPTRYIVYPGGNAFFIDEMVEDRLTESGARLDGDELETIFWPFFKPEIQRALDCFRNRELSVKAQRGEGPKRSILKISTYSTVAGFIFSNTDR